MLRDTAMSIERRTLRDLVEANGSFDVETAACFVVRLAQDLAYRHQLGQLYADFRPSVISVDRTCMPRLMAEIPNRINNYYPGPYELSEVEAYEAVDYLAPEQTLNSGRADQRSDIYGLGCLFYYMLTGRAPFEDGSVSDRLLKHQTVTPLPIAELQPAVPTTLSIICQEMLAKKPADRPQSAEEVVRRIDEWRRTSA